MRTQRRRAIKKLANLSNLTSMQKEVGYIFAKKGWNDRLGTGVDLMMSAIGDIVDATKCWGDGLPGLYREKGDGTIITPSSPSWVKAGPSKGPLSHLASAVIKIMNICVLCNWDLAAALLAKHEDNKNHQSEAPKI